MKLGIMQPYFFPYIGYFQIINYVDKWIIFDDVQYINHGWINRNRILHPKEGWQYIIVPLKKHSRDEVIRNIEIDNSKIWDEKLLGQLTHYKKKAPYYNETINVVKKGLSIDTDSITELNANILSEICKYLKIEFNYQISSKCDFDYSNVNDAGEWALRICEQLGADEYINPSGGIDLFDKNKFNNSNINLKFMKLKDYKYKQRRDKFEAGLSIIDVMMFNSVEEVREMLMLYNIYTK